MDRQNYPFVGTSIIAGTNSSVTGTASRLTATPTQVSEVELTALAANTQNVLIGNSASQVRVLVPSESISIKINDLTKIYVKSVSGTQTITYIGVL